MNILTSIILAASLSFDAFGIGLSYTLRNISIGKKSKFIIATVAFIITSIALVIGKAMGSFLSENFARMLSFVLLFLLGIFTIISALPRKRNRNIDKPVRAFQKNIVLKHLGLTVKIIKNPTFIDLDNSKKIESLEAMYLSLALSLDAFAAALSISFMKSCLLYFPLLACLFQLLFIQLGNFIAKKIQSKINCELKLFSLISGVILILLALSKLS